MAFAAFSGGRGSSQQQQQTPFPDLSHLKLLHLNPKKFCTISSKIKSATLSLDAVDPRDKVLFHATCSKTDNNKLQTDWSVQLPGYSGIVLSKLNNFDDVPPSVKPVFRDIFHALRAVGRKIFPGEPYDAKHVNDSIAADELERAQTRERALDPEKRFKENDEQARLEENEQKERRAAQKVLMTKKTDAPPNSVAAAVYSAALNQDLVPLSTVVQKNHETLKHDADNNVVFFPTEGSVYIPNTASRTLDTLLENFQNGYFPGSKPIIVCMFGEPGTGKSVLAKDFAKKLQQFCTAQHMAAGSTDGRPHDEKDVPTVDGGFFAEYNFSSLTTKETVSQFMGVTMGIEGGPNGNQGSIVDDIVERKTRVFFFDEFNRGHPSIIKAFGTFFESGTIKDNSPTTARCLDYTFIFLAANPVTDEQRESVRKMTTTLRRVEETNSAPPVQLASHLDSTTWQKFQRFRRVMFQGGRGDNNNNNNESGSGGIDMAFIKDRCYCVLAPENEESEFLAALTFYFINRASERLTVQLGNKRTRLVCGWTAEVVWHFVQQRRSEIEKYNKWEKEKSTDGDDNEDSDSDNEPPERRSNRDDRELIQLEFNRAMVRVNDRDEHNAFRQVSADPNNNFVLFHMDKATRKKSIRATVCKISPELRKDLSFSFVFSDAWYDFVDSYAAKPNEAKKKATMTNNVIKAAASSSNNDATPPTEQLPATAAAVGLPAGNTASSASTQDAAAASKKEQEATTTATATTVPATDGKMSDGGTGGSTSPSSSPSSGSSGSDLWASLQNSNPIGIAIFIIVLLKISWEFVVWLSSLMF